MARQSDIHWAIVALKLERGNMSDPDWYVDVNPDDQEDYGGDADDPTPDPDGWDDETSDD